LFSTYLQQWVKKNTHLFYIPCDKQWRGKQKYQVTNIGMKSTIVTFAVMTFKTVLTDNNCKLFLGLERKHKHKTYTLLRLCLIEFSSAHTCISFILVDYQGREPHGWVWLLYQSRKLHSALSEIVSLVLICHFSVHYFVADRCKKRAKFVI